MNQPRPQGADATIVKFEDRTDLSPEQRAEILAEREKEAKATN